ncbi:uncharacterized protein N7473_011090 [Penicillium subrubescens]|nr:uncharacterized protein N7473_011090 [Penicillium subrubescens]KAJ5882828.1 hypothetical protein N7473_011090 [Penicillium subrubescens]
MADTYLSEDAKKLLDDLALALRSVKTQDDGNGNLEYEHKSAKPFVEPILKTIGLPDWNFTVWMWNTSFKWQELPGPVNIIPICNITESARSEPGGALKFGLMRRIDGKVTVEPRLTAIFAVPPIAR